MRESIGEQKLYTFGSDSDLLCVYKYYLCTYCKRCLAPQAFKIAFAIGVPIAGIIKNHEYDRYNAPLDQHSVLHLNNKGPVLNDLGM